MHNRNIIVIGASSGGFQALKRLVADLPADFQASIFIVWHISADVRGILPQVLNEQHTVPAAHAVDREAVTPNRIYVAPPDHHLVLEPNLVRITHGPKENRFRPAVDPLFRSAAYAYGSRVIGVVLSGSLDDGTAGLWTIKSYGGIAVVQDPSDAEVPSMPESASRAVEVDYSVPLSELAALLVRLSTEKVEEFKVKDMKDDEKTKTEVHIALEESALNNGLLQLGSPSVYTCPECHGVLTSLIDGGRIRYRCHTGHAYSADSLLASLTESIEASLWDAIREMEKSMMLLNHAGDHLAESNQPGLAAAYFKKANDAAGRITMVRKVVLNHEQLNADRIRNETAKP